LPIKQSLELRVVSLNFRASFQGEGFLVIESDHRGV
jgi:hypothetical protein